MPPPSAISPSDLAAANARAASAEAEVVALQQQVEIEQAQHQAALGRIEALETELDDVANSPPTGGAGEPVLMRSSDPLTELVDDLRARSSAEVLREGDLVVVRVPDAFRPGSDALKNDVQLMTTLNATAGALVRHPAASVSVVGHTDGDPIQKSRNLWQNNDHLSRARAEKVAQVLSGQGVSNARISVEGRGFRDPLVSPEVSRADKARNRRVEILIRH
jgi:flagellar motor protein MotB